MADENKIPVIRKRTVPLAKYLYMYNVSVDSSF